MYSPDATALSMSSVATGRIGKADCLLSAGPPLFWAIAGITSTVFVRQIAMNRIVDGNKGILRVSTDILTAVNCPECRYWFGGTVTEIGAGEVIASVIAALGSV
jgi:hypothetical protein